MELSGSTLLERVGKIKPIKVDSVWTSATPFVELCRNDPPDWLYCSCEPGRYNPNNLPCVYFADGGRTARAEHACNEVNDLQPIVFFSAAVRIRHCLNLCDPKNLKILGIAKSKLVEDWERQKRSVTQQLGAVVANHSRFSAIVFPSAAAQEAKFTGKNIVIFRDSMRRPDFVKILGPTKRPLQQGPAWPVEISKLNLSRSI